MSAVLSPCGRYRYALGRDTGLLYPPGGGGTVVFVMLNPSTADAMLDDPTIRRCVGFARAWGYSRMEVGNVFALRATNPAELARAEDPVGPDNDAWLAYLAGSATEVVVAWGAHRFARERAAHVLDLLTSVRAAHVPGLSAVVCLGQTKDGSPKHPLYLAKATARVPLR